MIMKKLCYIAMLGFFTPVAAQTPVLADDVILTPSFFITILAGVILALAFQFILTAISVAAGITAIGDVREKYVISRVHPSDSNDKDREQDQDYSSDTAMGVKITTVFGIWSLITTCIALFGATALALNLSTIESAPVNTTVALVIWALFFLILFYLEAKVARTVVGNLISTATSGIKASTDAVAQMFSPSEKSKAESLIDSTVRRVRQEFDSGLGADKLNDVLDNFLTKVDKKVPDYNTLINDLEDIAKSSKSKNNASKWMAVQQVMSETISENEKSSDPDKQEKAKQMKQTLNELKDKYKSADGKEEGVKNVIEDVSSMDREEIDKRAEQVKKYISTSDADGFSAEKLQQAIEGLAKHPKMTKNILMDQAKDFGRKDVINLLSSNTNVDKEQYENYADKIEEAINSAKQKFSSEDDDGTVRRIEGQIANFFNSTGRRELNYELLKHDVQRILESPNDSMEIIKNRLSSFDEKTLRAVVTNNQYVEEEQIDNIVNTFESGKKDVEEKIRKIETKTNEQLKILERKAVVQAEHAKATATSAAWWLVLTGILSAVAALLGGMLPLENVL